MKAVYLGMSGGVDSSVSALLLQQQGYKVVGVYMKNWSKDLPGMKCPWAEDLADAKRVAVKLGIDFEVWDFEDAYREKVVDYMLEEFRKGNTPNPDVMCNQEIKFKLFYEEAMKRGADYIATGHYARTLWQEEDTDHSSTRSARPVDHRSSASQGAVVTGEPSLIPLLVSRVRSQNGGIPLLARAVDENKDQTYFLYRISDEALAHTLFPIGGMLKPDVKKMAEENGLHNAYKKESMGVCFVGEVGMKDFLKEYIDIKPGEIREVESEKVLGYHEGAVFYTIGQRHGLYLSGTAGEVNDGLPYYVVAKDLSKNIVYVSKNLNDKHIWANELDIKDIVLRQDLPESVLVRLRHRAPLITAKITLKKNNTAVLKFENEIKRPASGQSAVIYDGKICLGGGIIK